MATIALDLDGVFAVFDGPFTKLLQHAGSPISDGEWPSWNHGRDVSTPEQWAKAWNYVERDHHWWQTLPRHRDVTERVITLLDILDQAHNLVFVTARPHTPRTYQQTTQWLETYLKLWEPQVVLTPRSKPHAYYGIGPDIIVEDSLENVNGTRILDRNVSLLLVDRAYNRVGHVQPNIERAASTEMALERVVRMVGV